jgi:hypothetical protein
MENITVPKDQFKKLLETSEKRRKALIDVMQVITMVLGNDPEKWPKGKAGMIMRITKVIKNSEELESNLQKFTNPEYLKTVQEILQPDSEILKAMEGQA